MWMAYTRKSQSLRVRRTLKTRPCGLLRHSSLSCTKPLYRMSGVISVTSSKTRNCPADSTIKDCFIVQLEGNREVSREVKQYNLEMLIALGYRIKSKVATKFRQWATKHLKELMTKGRTEIETQPQLCSVSDLKQWSIPHAQGDSDSTSESPQVVIQK